MKTKTCFSLLMIFCLSLCFQVYGREEFTVKAKGFGNRIQYDERTLLLEFSHEVEEDSLDGKIELRDNNGSLAGNYTVEKYRADNTGKSVWIKFNSDFSLKESSKYYIDILRGLRYVRHEGKNGTKRYSRVGRPITLYFVTTSQCPFSDKINNSPSVTRTKLVLVSDIHIGDPRATAGNYNWFKDNVTEFTKFLDHVLNSKQVKELIIGGDLFDEWIMPDNVPPFAGTVTNNKEFFESCANAITMNPVIVKLNAIADSGIKLVYVPGNHDMLMSEAAAKAIFPKVTWQGNSDGSGNPKGTGSYTPQTGIVVEHGHIYDFFNAPDPLTKTGSLLPPGYFVSRLFATNMVSAAQTPQDYVGSAADPLFYAAWEIVLWKIFGTIEPNIPSIITGIDGYTGSYTYNQARDNYYDADIGGNWTNRQEINGVYSIESEISALLVGSGVFVWGNLEEAAWQQYLVPARADIVVFGHTHMAMLKAYNSSNNAIVTDPESSPDKDQLGPTRKIYANTGTWVNKSLLSQGYPTRTYVVINTDESALATVSLYQYNPDSDDTTDDVSVLLDEQNIHSDAGESLNLVP